MLSAKQIPKDGVGREKTLYGRGVRLKAKDLTKTTSTTLKITGMTSGAVWYVDLVVKGEGDGKPVRFSPPSATPPLGKTKGKNQKEPLGKTKGKKSKKNGKKKKKGEQK
jgi:hypothetical protein